MTCILTPANLIREFQQAGLYAGQTVIGAEQTVVDALMAVITPEGTLVMPTHSTDNSDPSTWRKPPLPPYRPESTPTNRVLLLRHSAGMLIPFW